VIGFKSGLYLAQVAKPVENAALVATVTSVSGRTGKRSA
jgi:hypothetical protein